MIYGNTFLDNDTIIYEAKFGMSKEEILKDPNKAVNTIKDMTNKKTENKSDMISFYLYALGIIGILAGSVVIPAAVVGILSAIGGAIIDTLNKKGASIMVYSKYEKNAKATKKTIVDTIGKIDKEISKTTDKQKLETLKKEKSELEGILNKVKEYKSEQEYYETNGFKKQYLDTAKEFIKDWINNYKNGKLPDETIYPPLPIGYYYCGVTKQEFEKLYKKYFKPSDILDNIDQEEIDDSKVLTYLQKTNKEFYEITYDGFGNATLYVPADKKFHIFIHDESGDVITNSFNSYEEIMNECKKELLKQKEYIQADVELGYYQLSEPPKGIEVKSIK